GDQARDGTRRRPGLRWSPLRRCFVARASGRRPRRAGKGRIVARAALHPPATGLDAVGSTLRDAPRGRPRRRFRRLLRAPPAGAPRLVRRALRPGVRSVGSSRGGECVMRRAVVLGPLLVYTSGCLSRPFTPASAVAAFGEQALAAPTAVTM